MNPARTLFLAAFVAALTPCVTAQQPAAPAKPTVMQAPAAKPGAPVAGATKGLQLKDGDRFIFIGDSITHQCQYTQFVENFFYTRYPEIRLHFRNAGVSGDRALDALNRFDEDIAAFKPTVATILLGMNDGTYKDFDKPTFDTYAKDMTQLLDKLAAINCRVIIMSPTMFDHQAWDARIKDKPDYARGRVPTGYNGVLAYYGKWLQEVARERKLQFVDLFSPLNSYTVQERAKNPNFTLIPDAIHPGSDGQFIMAMSLLTQISETGAILGAGVKVVNGQWQPLTPALVSDVKGNPGRSVSYSVKPKALPWVAYEAAPIGTKLTAAGHRASQEAHIVTGLLNGRYDLQINGEFVGTFDERMLGVHAEIQADPDSPTYKQSLKVANLNKERNEKAVHLLRDLWGREKGWLRKKTEDAAGYERWQAEFKAKRAELDALAAKYEDEIYKINQPAILKVEVVPSTKPLTAPAKATPAKPQPPKPEAKAPEPKKAA